MGVTFRVYRVEVLSLCTASSSVDQHLFHSDWKCPCPRTARVVVMRRSGIGHINAAQTYIALVNPGTRKLKAKAVQYKTIESFPFQSRPMAFLKSESFPSARRTICCSK